PPPQGLPELPPPRPVTDAAQRPVVPLAPPRMLACNPLGTVLRVASELLECGRARYQREELEEAREAFQRAIRESSDRRLLREASWARRTSGWGRRSGASAITRVRSRASSPSRPRPPGCRSRAASCAWAGGAAPRASRSTP